jgi:sodium/proline symporter
MAGAVFSLVVVLVAYLAILISLGIYQGRKVRSGEDFAIGSRKVPGFIAAMSERATGESSWCLLGLPGLAYASGLSSIWSAVGCVAGIVTAWCLLAWRLRDEAERYNVVSFVDYIAKRYSSMERWIRIFSSLTITFFFFFYVGAQFLGGGKTLFTMFGLRSDVGMVLTALVIMPYAAYGGFKSVVYTDTLQAALMIFTLVVAPLVGIAYIATQPGLYASSIPEALVRAGGSYSSITGAATGFASGVVMLSGLSWLFGYLGGTPQLTVRFMSISDSKQAKIARNTGVIWTVLGYMGALCIGWVGLAIFGPQGLQDPETVMPAVMLELFPPALAALFITGALAAMFSTADSLLILASTELSENIVKPLLGTMTPKKSVTTSRILTVLLAVVALCMSFVAPSDVIYTIVGYVWAGIGCPFSVIILLTLFWKRFNAKATLVTIIVGMVFTIVWITFGFEETVLTSRAMSFFVSLFVAVVTALVTGPDSAG